jgi:hypothetical protein
MENQTRQNSLLNHVHRGPIDARLSRSITKVWWQKKECDFSFEMVNICRCDIKGLPLRCLALYTLIKRDF